MEVLTQKWVIAALLEEVDDGVMFLNTDWPLHITLAGVFAIDKNGSWLATELGRLLEDQAAVTVTAEEPAMFGVNQDVPVMKVQKTPELLGLYEKIHLWLTQSGAVFNSPQYESEGYAPHSTEQKTGKLEVGQQLTIKSISVVDMLPDSEGEQRRIIATIPLIPH